MNAAKVGWITCTPRVVTMALLAGAILAGAEQTAGAGQAPACAAGAVFVLPGAPLVPGSLLRLGGDRLILGGGRAVIASGCAPAHLEVQQVNGGHTELEAVWHNCVNRPITPSLKQGQHDDQGLHGEGLTIHFTGVTNATCTTLDQVQLRTHQPGGGSPRLVQFDHLDVPSPFDPVNQGAERIDQFNPDQPEHCEGSLLLDGLDYLCKNVLPSLGTSAHCEVKQPSGCHRSTREIFTGVDVYPPMKSGARWNHFGGRGAKMAYGALCQLQDLKNAQSGRVLLGARDSGQAGAQQTVGFLSYDPNYQRVRGYHRVAICLPFLGCFDAHTQEFSAEVNDQWMGLGPDATVGDYPVSDTLGLRVTADEMTGESVSITGPTIPVDTAIGEFDIVITVDYGKDAGGQGTAFRVIALQNGGTTQSQFGFPYPGLTTLTDLLGNYNGMLFSAHPTPALRTPFQSFGSAPDGVGWVSQLGLGSRGGGAPWSSGDVRPDLDLARARNTAEKTPIIAANASASVTHTIPIPDEVKEFVSSFDGHATLTVKLSADVASQLSLYSAEAVHETLHGEAGSDLHDRRHLSIERRVDMGFSMTVTPELKIHMSFPIPFVPDFDLDLKYDVTLPFADLASNDCPNGDLSRCGGYIESNETMEPLDPPSYTSFHTIRGQDVADGDAFMRQCLASPPASRDLPPPQYTAPPKNPPFYGPCNVCVGYPVRKGLADWGMEYVKVFPSSPQASTDWTCNQQTVKCGDLCLGRDVVQTAPHIPSNHDCTFGTH